MTEERKSTDIAMYILGEDTIPDLVDETGMDADRWVRILAADRSFGLRSKVYIVPSEVRWRSLLAKYAIHVGDCEGTSFIGKTEHSDDGHDLTDEEREMIHQLIKEVP